MPMTREQLLQQQASARIYQARYDDAFQPWGVRADAPVLGQDPGAYRRDLADRAERQLPEDHALRGVRFRRLPADASEVMEPQLLDALRSSAMRPDAVPRGAIERRETVDGNGLKIVNWLGAQSFVHDFPSYRRGRRVTSFRTDFGYVDGSGRPLR